MEIDELFEMDEALTESSRLVREMISAIHRGNGMDKTLWDERWVDEVLLPLRRELIEAQRHIVKAQALLEPDIKEASEAHKDYS